MKQIFKIATAVLIILTASSFCKIDEKEFLRLSVEFNKLCQTDKELADAFHELITTQIAVDENEDTSLVANKKYFKEHNIPLKYYEVIKRSAEQVGKDYKKMKKQMTEEYSNVNMPSLQEALEKQRQAYLESKKQQ